ncbi:MAG: hypothetical protein ACRELX_10480 [Longimicrobiales bacterium]
MPELRPEKPTLLETAVGFVTNFFDALGIGSFAPTTAIFRFKGVVPDERMPGTLNVGHTLPTIVQCAFLMPVASAKFLQAGSYSARPALGLALGGIPAVLIAALIVKSLPLTAVRWLVVFVVLYAAFTMIRSGLIEWRRPVPTVQPVPRDPNLAHTENAMTDSGRLSPYSAET